jgi:hypothetical protein
MENIILRPSAPHGAVNSPQALEKDGKTGLTSFSTTRDSTIPWGRRYHHGSLVGPRTWMRQYHDCMSIIGHLLLDQSLFISKLPGSSLCIHVGIWPNKVLVDICSKPFIGSKCWIWNLDTFSIFPVPVSPQSLEHWTTHTSCISSQVPNQWTTGMVCYACTLPGTFSLWVSGSCYLG